ncbi:MULTISPECIES: SusC/RagA family TonB-linked outer membrane protein [Butyricimonas]|uniref:SusC/RagA family TonB-linked outer membrane protein n=1 Tax=Butyricimonas TaxID=574697 RepID=UPI001D0989FB|nr:MULTISPECIES: SusC/RagA family TonB-linked outer membrane protein [Butyricimonas]MCB6972178.1 SusC/RagA family TonB-linked outer membrane protein [Butyricimonas synergistica]MCG4519259.1 SusC/RagA family TonB-linked outer membrane protein [Butyricimonas sp. DFI.6.44]
MEKKKRTAYIFVSFLFLSVSLLCSKQTYAQDKTVNLNYKDASFVEVINEFRKQTGVKFMYNLEKVKDKRCKDLVVENTPVKEAIDIVLKHFGLSYSMVEGVVVVKEKSEEPQTKRVIKGTVFDESKEPLPGVTVLIKGTTVGVSTDVNGNFSITIPDTGEQTLIFTFIGMQRQEVACKDDKPLRIVMKLDETQLEEVEVVETGYNRLPRKDMVGSFTTVKAEDILMPGANSIDQMLQGKIPGMVVVNSSSRVGSKPQITIRGRSTLLGNTDPLWVVDGIIQADPLDIDATQYIASDLKNLIGNQISWLNPADIETITVLKDASATAIYGSKASNGVIVITTKQGKTERTSVRYSVNFSMRARPNYGMFNLMNSKERIQFSKEAYDAGARYQSDPLPQIYTYEGLMALYNQRKISESEFTHYMEWLESCNTDWFDLLTRNSFSHNHNLSISGGSKKTTYNASFGYNNSRGIEIGDELNQFTSRLNVTSQLWEKVRVTFNMNASINNGKGFGPGVSPLSYATNTSRAVPAFEENGAPVFYKEYGSYTWNGLEKGTLQYGFNFMNEFDNSYSKNKNTRISSTVNLDWDITNWLKYSFVGSISTTSNHSNAYAGEKTKYIASNYRGYDYGTERPNSDKFNAAMLPYGGQLTTNTTNATNYNMQHKVSISRTFNDIHRLNAMLAVELTSNVNKNNTNTVWGYVPERGEILVKPTAPSQIIPISYSNVGDWAAFETLFTDGGWKNTTITNNSLSFFGTIAYALKDRYVLNANIRGDGSNRFGQDSRKRFDPTYSFGFSWRMAEENFIKDNIVWLNQLNLRATYGIQGYVVTTISPDLICRQQGVLAGYNEYNITISSIPNPYLKWERTRTWNFGLDMQLFKGISMVFEYYGRRSNTFLSENVAEEYGMPSLLLNGGRIKNEGVEFSINITPYKRKDFVWTVGFNASKNWNSSQSDDVTTKVNKLTKTSFISGSGNRPLKKGYPLGAFWSYSFAGLNPENGYPEFNFIDYETADPEIDPTTFLVYSGSKDPYFTGGFNTSARYKSLQLSAYFSALVGAKKRLPNPYSDFSNGKLPSPLNNLSKDLNKRWKKPGDEQSTIIPALYTSVDNIFNLATPDGNISNSRYSMWANSDAMVVNASFFRCTSISLSWNMSQKLCQKFGATSFSVSAAVSNPFVIASKRFNGFDPELSSNSSQSVMPKVFSFGLSLGF